MIIQENIPLPLPSRGVAKDPRLEPLATDPDLSRDEEAALQEHLGEVRAFSELVNAENAARGLPIIGEMAGTTIPSNEAQGGLMPLDNPQAWVARGYMDPEGNITPAGENYFLLEDQGLFDQKGQLTPKGQAFALPKEAAMMPEFLDQYILRDRYGLNQKEDRPMGDIVADVGGYVWDAVKGTAKLAATNPMVDYWTAGLLSGDGQAEKEAEAIIAGQSFAEGSLENMIQLGSGVATIRDKALASMTGDDRAYYAAKQRGDMTRNILALSDIGDMALQVGVSDEVVNNIYQNREMARMVLGDEKADILKRQGESAGSLVGDPSNLASMGIGAAVGGGIKFPNVLRNVERSAQAALAAEDAAAVLAKTRAIADKTTRAAGLAAQQAKNLKLTGIDPARMETLAGKLAGTSMEAAEAIPALELKAQAAATYAQTMAKQAGGMDKVMQVLQTTSEIGRQVRAAPARAIAPAIEAIGNKMIAADNAIWGGLEKLGATPQTISGLRGGLAALGVSTGGVAAPFAALAAGPVVRGVGNFTRVLGQELMQARGTTPFWQRVAQNSAISPVGRATAHLIDNATLSGKVFAPIRLAGTGLKGAAAAAPVDIAFEVVSEGGDLSPATLKQGLAESLLFGGPAAMGGAIVKGDVNTLRAKSAGDEINLRKRLDPESLAGFSRMNHGLRRNMATYAGAFPTLDFKVTEDGPNAYDRTTNTVTINRNSPDPLKGIIAHEVNHYLQVQGQMEEGIRAMLVGDGVNGGLLRSADGTLDPNFKSAMDAYNARLPETQRLSPEDFAVEYFNEATVNNLMGMTDSGDLQRAAGRSDLERMMRGISARLIKKTPLLQNIFFNTGGALDSKGGFVQGNGLLAAGVRELPGAKAMLKQMVNDQAGRSGEKIMGPGDEKITIPAAAIKGNKPLQDAFFGTLKTDEEGNVLTGPDGMPEIIDKATDEVRSRAGLSIIEDQTKKIKEGKPLAEGEIAPTESGNFEGTHVPEVAIEKLKGTFNAKQRKAWKALNESSKNWDGATFNVIYQPALKTTKRGKKIYEGLPATFREVVPVGVSTTAKGNILIHFFSVTQFVENIRKKAKTALGKELYKGNENAIREDAEAVMALHRQNKTTDAYFAQKYGEIEGVQRKNFINTIFGLMTPEQRNVNPLFSEKDPKNEGVYKTYRLDRINQTTRLQGRTPLPFSYTSVKANLFPNGEP